MAVNQFCYDYTDRLTGDMADKDNSMSLQECDQVREAMLIEWQQWQQRIYALATAKVATKRREAKRRELDAE